MRLSRCGSAKPSGAAAIGTEDVLIYALFCAPMAKGPAPPLFLLAARGLYGTVGLSLCSPPACRTLSYAPHS